jgi:hypothetical protein
MEKGQALPPVFDFINWVGATLPATGAKGFPVMRKNDLVDDIYEEERHNDGAYPAS